jgi:hypothetical protein
MKLIPRYLGLYHLDNKASLPLRLNFFVDVFIVIAEKAQSEFLKYNLTYPHLFQNNP